MFNNNKKKILILLFIISAIFMTTANANSISLNEMKNEIESLKKRIYEIDENNSKNGHLSDIQMNGDLHIQIMNHNNKGSAYGLMGGDVAKSRMLNFQGTRLKVGGVKKLSPKSSITFKIYTDKEGLGFEDIFFTFNMTNNFSFDFGQVFIENFIFTENDINYLSMPDFVRFEKIANLFPNKAIGLSFKHLYDNIGIYYGFYGNSIKDYTSENNKVIFNSRFYYNPYKTQNSLLHLGLGTYYKNEDFSTNNVNVEKVDLINKKFIPYDLKHTIKGSIELAGLYKNFMFLSEYSIANLTPSAYDLKKAKASFNVNSYYLQGSFILTGEDYIYKNGKFNRFKVAKPFLGGGYGAFELAYRFSKTDAQDTDKGFALDYGEYIENTITLSWAATDFHNIFLSYTRMKEIYTNNFLKMVNNNKKNNSYDIIQANIRIFF